ncbi:hypothetical protein [Dactylosporangium sp. NPDC006015]|uniref:hypothetical protein n=1 Tax=Dactylosporangium sp. NPDC006015 TaxID=3154576 RepID=UPI0033A2E0A7
MGYWGTIVLALCEQSITEQPATTGFGWRHVRVRDLGDGWQLLETSNPASDPPDLVVGAQEWVRTVGTPVLAAYVCNSDCAGVTAATPSGEVWSLHLPDPNTSCHVYRHNPKFDGGRTADWAARAAAGWARAAGLAASESHLDWLMQPRPMMEEDRYLGADDLVFELVLALGIATITPSRAKALDPESAPYHLISDRMGGLAQLARDELAARAHRDEAPDAWMTDAVRLEQEIWAAVFAADGAEQAAQLAERADQLRSDYLATVEAAGPPTPTVVVGGREVTSSSYLGYTMHQMLGRGNLNNPMMAAMFADRRHDLHPVRRKEK